MQHRSERPHSLSTERTLRVIGRVGQSVNLAVERFVTVGETIADDNPEIKQDMYDACKEARTAGNFTFIFIIAIFVGLDMSKYNFNIYLCLVRQVYR